MHVLKLFIAENQRAYCDSIIIFKVFFRFFFNPILSILIMKARDIELNLGPSKKSHSYFSGCHWNVNSLPNDNYCNKVAALKAYNFIYKCDFV